jgi:hypothetical protein
MGRPLRSTQRSSRNALPGTRPAACIVDFRAEDGRLRGWQAARLPVELLCNAFNCSASGLPRTAWRKEDKHDERVEIMSALLIAKARYRSTRFDGSATRLARNMLGVAHTDLHVACYPICIVPRKAEDGRLLGWHRALLPIEIPVSAVISSSSAAARIRGGLVAGQCNNAAQNACESWPCD